MTWLKVGDEFPDDCAAVQLSSNAFRLHVEGLSWVMKRESGGTILRHELRRVSCGDFDPFEVVKDLVAVGFWAETAIGWEIRHHMEDQRTPDQIQADRIANRARQAKSRAAAKAKAEAAEARAAAKAKESES